MRKFIIVLISSFIFLSCRPIPSYLDNHILQDTETKRIYKLHWLSGQGEKWYFEEQILLANGEKVWILAPDTCVKENETKQK